MQTIKQQVLTRYQEKMGVGEITSCVEPKEGLSYPIFLINDIHVVKVYDNEWGDVVKFHNHFQQMLQGYHQLQAGEVSGVPELLYAEVVGPTGMPITISTLVGGTNASEVFFALSDEELKGYGVRFGEMLQSIHRSTFQTTRKYDTTPLVMQVAQQYHEAKQKPYLPDSLAQEVGELLSTYTPKVISEEVVLCHRDIQLTNILLDGDRQWLLDRDNATLAPAWCELGSMLRGVYVPAEMVSEEVEPKYPFDRMITWFEGALSTCPKLISKKYYEEIELLLWYEILRKYNIPEWVKNIDPAIERGSHLHQRLIKEEVLSGIN